MEIKRNKEWRKVQSKKLQNKRLKLLDHTPTDRHKGRYKDNHMGCGCPMCKPWKHKLDDKMKPSDRKKK